MSSGAKLQKAMKAIRQWLAVQSLAHTGIGEYTGGRVELSAGLQRGLLTPFYTLFIEGKQQI